MFEKCLQKENPSDFPRRTRRLQWGVLGRARIARRCVIPALNRARNGELRGLACRSEERVQSLAREHEIPVACASYEELLEDP
ncbi:MAG: hypothetical protein OEW45_18330 [Deltaproteobacteria bacterium]|nr:hypothetical protein [Deltaproteobacteria bacterium]